MIRKFSRMSRLALVGIAGFLAVGAWAKPDYAIVVSRQTQADPAWNEVVEALKAKHSGVVIVYQAQPEETLSQLRELFPRYACFVAKPAEVGRAFVAQVHQLTRKLDDDPYADCFWGILTGYDAQNALRIARCGEPLTVHKVASGTEVALEMCEEGVCFDELVKNKLVRKEKGGEPRVVAGPDDTTEALAKTLTEYYADLFVTSGHATEREWMIGYRYKNGFFRCADGELYGIDTRQEKFPIRSPNPKVYLPVGNCLMGHVDGLEAMALAWMNSGGVNQMMGYTVPSWYGYAGWGCLDYFLEQPGRYTFTEAFFANQHALIHRLKTYFPGAESAQIDARGNPKVPASPAPAANDAKLDANDLRGLLYDRDSVAYYGDPAWVARMAPGSVAWDQTLAEKAGVWTLTIKPNRGDKTFDTINRNGSQRGGRPILAFLPKRVRDVKIIEGRELAPEITDDFMLLPNPRKCDPTRAYRVVFQAGAATP